jgi:heme exporter protein D
MSGYSSDFWLALCASLTGLGLVLTVLLGRRRGVRSMLHGAAWSLIPIAAYLTGSTQMLWRIGVAIGDWASSFVFSTQRWAGVAVAGLIVVLFLVSGGRRRRRQARVKRQESRQRRAQESQAATGAPGAPSAIGPSRTLPAAQGAQAEPEPARRGRRPQAAQPGLGDDMAEIEEILRKRGIN